MTVVSTVPLGFPLDSEIIHAIFSSIGRCTFMDEKHFDACTALSASGPAFVCLVLEAMADGGVMMGLPRVEALELAAQSSYPSIKLYCGVGLMTWRYFSITRDCQDGTSIRLSPSTNKRLSDQYVMSCENELSCV